MIDTQILYKNILEEFSYPIIVDQGAKSLGLISEERGIVEKFLKESKLSDINAKSIMDIFGYDFSGFLAFLTGNEIKAIFPSLVSIIFFESEICEDLDLSLLAFFSQSCQYDQQRLESFKNGLTQKQIALVIEVANWIFSTLDDTIIYVYDFKKSNIQKSFDLL